MNEVAALVLWWILRLEYNKISCSIAVVDGRGIFRVRVRVYTVL